MVLAISVLTASLAVSVMSSALTDEQTAAVQSSMMELKAAVRRYCDDTGIMPATLDDLVAMNGVPRWSGPYVTATADCAASTALLPLDPWGHAYLWSLTGTRTGRLLCTGADGVLDGATVNDDLFTPVDLTDILRAKTQQELEDLNLAIASYNTINLPAQPLPANIELLVTQLIASGLLQGTVTAWATDAFGAFYVPGPAPVQEVKCAGTTGSEPGE
ncbi:MAG: type II secretion system protein GspG [Planctomycetota bacterium]